MRISGAKLNIFNQITEKVRKKFVNKKEYVEFCIQIQQETKNISEYEPEGSAAEIPLSYQQNGLQQSVFSRTGNILRVIRVLLTRHVRRVSTFRFCSSISWSTNCRSTRRPTAALRPCY